MKPHCIDHLVLTVASIDATVVFYKDILGFETLSFGEDRQAVCCGSQKINLHEIGAELLPHAKKPTAGSGDICLIYDGSIEKIVAHLAMHQIETEEGPVVRTGAFGNIKSVYIRDLDGNLIELSVYI